MFELIPFGKKTNDLFDYFNELERSFFNDKASHGAFVDFKTDIIDNGDSFTMEADLPGFEKKDIKLEIKDGRLNICAEKNDVNEEKKDNFVRRERRYGSVCRSFDISGIDEEKISADYSNGVLTINLPKLEEKPKLGKTIEIK